MIFASFERKKYLKKLPSMQRVNPYPAELDESSISKQLGSGWDAELLGISPRSKLFDTGEKKSSTLNNYEAP